MTQQSLRKVKTESKGKKCWKLIEITISHAILKIWNTVDFAVNNKMIIMDETICYEIMIILLWLLRFKRYFLNKIRKMKSDCFFRTVILKIKLKMFKELFSFLTLWNSKNRIKVNCFFFFFFKDFKLIILNEVTFILKQICSNCVFFLPCNSWYIIHINLEIINCFNLILSPFMLNKITQLTFSWIISLSKYIFLYVLLQIFYNDIGWRLFNNQNWRMETVR